MPEYLERSWAALGKILFFFDFLLLLSFINSESSNPISSCPVDTDILNIFGLKRKSSEMWNALTWGAVLSLDGNLYSRHLFVEAARPCLRWPRLSGLDQTSMKWRPQILHSLPVVSKFLTTSKSSLYSHLRNTWRGKFLCVLCCSLITLAIKPNSAWPADWGHKLFLTDYIFLGTPLSDFCNLWGGILN